MKQPTNSPISGPITGIRAVIPIITEITAAFGKRKILIPIKQSTARINASVNCPVMKFEKEADATEQISRNLSWTFVGNVFSRILSTKLPIFY